MQGLSIANHFAGHSYKDLNFTSAEIIHAIDAIHGLLMKAGCPVRPYSGNAVQTLHHLDEARRKSILENLTNLKIILSSIERLDGVNEFALADTALKHFNLHLRDHDWLNTHHDEIIEIYSPQGIQLYRSLNFFKTCGYSLLDLCVHEWYVLWERPKSVIDHLHAVVTEVLAGRKKDTRLEVGPHLIRETYDDGTTQPFQPRTAIVEFRNIYPAFNFNQDAITGFVVTSRGRLVSDGDEVRKVAFI